MTPVVLDTETTGFAEPILPVQVCMIELEGDDPRDLLVGGVWKQEFNPGKEIEYGAMSTHFFSNEQVKIFQDWDPAAIPEVDMYIGHSIDYDWKAVGSPTNVRRICTYAMAKRAWPDLDKHSLGAILVYLLGPVKAFPMLKHAHQADTDAANTLELVKALAKEWDIASWDEFWDLSETCRLPETMQFGKYGPDKAKGFKGMPLPVMIAQDPSYTRWVLGLEDLDPYLRKAIITIQETI